LIKEFIQLVYPDYCSGCNQQLQFSETGICSSCLVEVRNYSLIASNIPFGRNIVMKEIYVFKNFKNPLIQKMIYEIKYNGNKSTAYTLGVELGSLIKRSKKVVDFDIIIPVPVSKLKKQQRGYNQCQLIAEGVSNIIKTPIISNYLIRNNNMTSQVKSSRYNRWLNVDNDYQLIKELKNGIRILLIDDVVTTGATINSCLNAIQKNKKFNITVAALAGNKFT
jgi:ComF family protein